MTRIVIFGDLHANWEALLALQRAERRPDMILCLGDIVGYGPDPKLCLDSIRTAAAHLISGQHDAAVGGSHNFDEADELAQATWAYTRSVLPQQDRDYLAWLPKTMNIDIAGTRFYLTRLGPDNRQTETHTLITMPQEELRKQVGNVEADVILLGGPHAPALRQIDQRLIVCPGSLGQPRYGVPDPTFAVWEDGHLQVHHLHYQFRTTLCKLSLMPLDPEHILQLQLTLRTGGLN